MNLSGHPQLSAEANAKLVTLIVKTEMLIKSLPEDYDENGVLIGNIFTNKREKSQAKDAKYFFYDCILKRGELSNLLVGVIELYMKTLPSDPMEAFKIANAPEHPIRNCMIRNEVDLIEEKL